MYKLIFILLFAPIFAVAQRDNWRFKNIIRINAQSEQPVKKYIPKGYRLYRLYAGYLDNDRQKDYCMLLLPDTLHNNEDSLQALRPLTVVLSNNGHAISYSNDHIAWPFFWGKYSDAFAEVVFHGKELWVMQMTKSDRYTGASLFVQVFRYNDHSRKLIYTKMKEYELQNNTWWPVKGKDQNQGKDFTQIKNEGY
ncbi:hypothetical protein ACTHGU_17600 [Chitinophagaceae bacterium MMS25-I14]